MIDRNNQSPTRWLFVLAGAAATFVTLVRALAGGANDLRPLRQALAANDLAGVVEVNWHALSAIFACLSIALFVASRSSRGAARAIGTLAGLSFGATCISFMVVSARMTGSPFTWFPWLPLGIASVLAFTAAARA